MPSARSTGLGEAFDHMTPASPISSKDLRKPKLEPDIEHMDSKNLPPIPGKDDLVNINGYKVKNFTAPILEGVFAKYGDIMANCACKSTSLRASLLEVVSNIVQRLKHHDIEAILSNMEDIEDELSDLEASRIDVSWLHEHLARLREISGFKEKSLQHRETKVKSRLVIKATAKEMKQRHAELVLAQERFREAEKRVDAMRLVIRKIDDDIMESESEEYFWKRRLDQVI
ncbi:hypothetical protein OROGR_029041 [Orobanche gracilis]